jgi:thiol-disulfide isomerase/thioredoxin
MARALAAEGLKWWQEPSARVPLCADVSQLHDAVADAAAREFVLVVKFFSEECYSCKSLSPKFHKLAESYADVIFVKVNGATPEFSEFVAEQGIRGVPWFLFYRGGKCVHGMSASLSPERLSAFRREIVHQRKLQNPALCSGGSVDVF